MIGLVGPGKGFRFLLNEDLHAIGRDPNNDISLDDVTVSRRHAEIIRNAQKFTIRDLKSLNGTYVNARSVSDYELQQGDELQIGKYKFHFFQNISGK